MLLRIPKRPPGSRRQRELKRTEGDKLQAGQGRPAARVARGEQHRARSRSSAHAARRSPGRPSQPALRRGEEPHCRARRGLPGTDGLPSGSTEEPPKPAPPAWPRRRNAGDRGGGNCPSGRGGPGPDPLLSSPLAPPAGAPGHVGKGASAPGGVLPSWGQQADLRGPGNRGRQGGTGEAGQPPVTPFALLL